MLSYIIESCVKIIGKEKPARFSCGGKERSKHGYYKDTGAGAGD